MKIIFVCTGNTCRSPLAEAIGKMLLPNDEIYSRGLSALDGYPISYESLQIIKEESLPLPSDSKRFTEADLEADLILTMTEEHKRILQSRYKHNNIDSLKHYASGVAGDVKDPFGQSLEIYRQTYKEIRFLIEQF